MRRSANAFVLSISINYTLSTIDRVLSKCMNIIEIEMWPLGCWKTGYLCGYRFVS
jgi:hypothetical protein